MSALVQLYVVGLLLISMSYAWEQCTKKSHYGFDEFLTCSSKCCGDDAYSRYCCTSSNSISSGSTFTFGTILNTPAIIGISCGSIVFVAIVAGIIRCVVAYYRSPRRPGQMITPNQPGVTVVSTGHANPVYPGLQEGGNGVVYQPPQAYPPPVDTQPNKTPE